MTDISPELRQSLAGAVDLAIARQQAGDSAGAEALYIKVLSIDGSNAVALHNLGLLRLHGGNNAVAVELLEAAVRQQPAEPVFHFNLAFAYQHTQRLPDAVQSYRRAIQLNPSYRAAWENLGVALQDMGVYDDAKAAYRQALSLEPCSVVAHKNLIAVLRAQGQPDDALRQCADALDCEPASALFACQKGAILLSKGDFQSGWPLYEWRYWEAEALETAPPHRVPLPKWNGGDLRGKGIVACGEEGIGDEIMFASCIPDLAARAAAVMLVCAPRLVPLFARSFPQVEVRAAHDKVTVLELDDEYGYRIALPSLPQYVRTTADAFDGRPFLKADPGAVDRWHKRLASLGNKPKIGLSWRGGLNPRDRIARSLELEQLRPLLECGDVIFVDVQYGNHSEELSKLTRDGDCPLVSFPDADPLRDMDDFAALLTALDLVISVDNSTVHLAGALGVPTWVLLPFLADWRWQLSGESSVWYASVRLWRQDGHGTDAWDALLHRVARELHAGVPVSSLVSHTELSPPAVSQQNGRGGGPRALLLNDTSYWYHWGCTCTSLALHQGLREAGYVVESVPITVVNGLSAMPRGIEDFDSEAFFQAFCAAHPALLEQLRRCDVVVVNGEGTLHGLGHSAVALLYLMHLAKHWLGKNTQVINHSCYPADVPPQERELADAVYRKVYSGLDRVVVRESRSAAELNRLGIAAAEGFDCLPLFVLGGEVAKEARGKRIVIAGTVALTEDYVSMMVELAESALTRGYELDVLVGANAYLAQDDMQFVNALHRRLRGRYRLVAATDETQWLEALGRAALLVSGRFHHTIAAACLGTPFLVGASNTDKIAGLLERLDIKPDDVWISPERPAEAVSRLERLLRTPEVAVVSDSTRERLLELAGRNFSDPD